MMKAIGFEATLGSPREELESTLAEWLTTFSKSEPIEATLTTQARSAAMGHGQAAQVSDEQLRRIVEFESQVYVAQISDRNAGNLAEPGGPASLGPKAMADRRPGVLGDNDYDPVFLLFDAWKKPGNASQGNSSQDRFRASVARGADIFMFRQFWLRDTTHINSIGLGNPLKRTCATCHNAQMTGQDLSAGWVDLGTTKIGSASCRERV